MPKHPKSTRLPAVAALAGLLAWLAAASPAAANERRFANLNESDPLPPGEVEIEPWVTMRAGRDDYYRRMDYRLEFEMGVVEGLHTALYLNWSAIATADGDRLTSTGISNEWKWQLSDPNADALGFAFYFEPRISQDAAELELKLLFDKRMGDLLLAANIVGEYEWEWELEENASGGSPGRETEREASLDLLLAAGWFLAPRATVGLESRLHNEWKGGTFAHSVLSAGPSFSYGGEGWWATGAVLGQIYSPTNAAGTFRDLGSHEAVEARIILGMHI